MQRHRLSAHSNERPFTCSFEGCEKAFALKHHLSRHEKTHLNKKSFACTFDGCAESFSKHDQLRRHICTEHTGEPVYKCETCSLGFDTRSRYRKHQKTAHSGKIYLCGHDDCLAAFSKWSEVVAHRRTEHKKVFVCSECGKTDFSDESAFRRHLGSHRVVESTPQICPKCGKDFLSRKSLRAHLLAVHETVRPFSCSICNVSYGYKKLLIKHMERVHSNDRTALAFDEEQPIPDTIDPKLTEEFTLHNVVSLQYVEEREIACPVEGCGRRFGRSFDLDRHLKAAHSVLEFIE